jgi:hypothetical protein
MQYNFNKEKEKIKLYCTDKEQNVDAEIISMSDKFMVVLIQPGDIRLVLNKQKPGMYIGSIHGLEFVYNE